VLCKVKDTSSKYILQAEAVSDAAWGSDWIGTPVPFQRCLIFIIATARREFTLTAGKFVSVSRETMLTVSSIPFSNLGPIGDIMPASAALVYSLGS
jgi:hypothetical protein